MANPIRGSQATLTVVVDGRRFTLLTKTWRSSADMEIKKNDYAGQRTSLPDPQFNGYDGSWDCDEEDGEALELAQLLADRERNGLTPPSVSIQCRYAYRKTGVRPRIELFTGVVLKPGQREQGGRKDNITNAFEFVATDKKLVTA